MISTTSTLILDEADQLLEMGFRPDIERILKALPSSAHRQTLLFSATLPDDVLKVVGMALRPDFKTIDCISQDPALQTATQVRSCHHLHPELSIPSGVLLCPSLILLPTPLDIFR